MQLGAQLTILEFGFTMEFSFTSETFWRSEVLVHVLTGPPDAPIAHQSSRVQAKQADARRRILSAARTVVAEQGFVGAQVAVVAAVADVATGTIYRHFASKAALFSEMLRVVCDRELEVFKAIAEETDRTVSERVRDAVAAFVDRALRSGGLAYAVIVEPIDPAVDLVRLEARAALASVIADLIREGISSNTLPEQDAGLLGAAVVGAFLEGVVEPLGRPDPERVDRKAIATEIAEFCVSALSRSA